MGEKVKALAILPAIIPSTTILVVEPLMYLAGLGKIEFRLRLENFDARLSDLEWADLVIFCRNTEPAHEILERLLALGKPYIYELDDNFFELPLDTPEGRYHRDINRIAMLEKYLKHAGLVRVYSPLLQDRARQYTQKVISARAPVNLEAIPHEPPLRDPKKVKILFSTSRTASDRLSKIFMKDLVRLLDDYDGKVEVHFWGYMPHDLKGLHSVKFRRFMSNYPRYLQAVYDAGYDIGLAPLKDDLFHNSKTNNKFREYSACWIAGVYSNAAVYRDCVEHGRTGLLVPNEEDAWYEAMKQLMDDPGLRESIQTRARAHVENEYAFDIFASSLLNDINQVLAGSRGSYGSNQASKPVAAARNGWTSAANTGVRLFRTFVSRVQKIPRSLQEHGVTRTIRLAFEQIDRYVRYFELIRKINRRQGN